MPVYPQNTIDPPYNDIISVTASADGVTDIDEIIRFTKSTVVVAVVFSKPVAAVAEVLLNANPRPVASGGWASDEVPYGGLQISGVTTSVTLLESTPITSDGYLRVRTTGGVAGNKRVVLYVRAFLKEGGT